MLDEFLSLTECDLSTYDMSMSILIYEYEVIIKLNYSKMSSLCYTCQITRQDFNFPAINILQDKNETYGT